MKRFSLFSLTCLFLFLFVCTAWAAPERVQVIMTPGTAANTTNINLLWPTTAGETLVKSTDGETWTPMNITSNAGQSSSYVLGVANYSNIFFEVRDSNYSDAIRDPATYKRVNVYPPNPNGHANFDNNTDMCKGCHSAHNAKRANLLKESTVESFCNSCHDGSGSKYGVTMGTVKTASGTAKALGGLFQGAAGQGPFGKAATSSHSVDESGKLAPGGGATLNLTCTTCHQGHATNNNFRMLKSGSLVEAYPVNPGSGETANYKKGMTSFCSTCHNDYLKSLDGDTYRHKMDVGLVISGQNLTTSLPLESSKVACITCHYAHGSAAEGDNPSSIDRSGDGQVTSADVSTMMKRKDYMGVCEDCHKK